MFTTVIRAHVSAAFSTLGTILVFITEMDIFEQLATVATIIAALFASYHYYESAKLRKAERKRLEKES